MKLAMPLVFVPLADALFFWEEHAATANTPGSVPAWANEPGAPARFELVTPSGRREVTGVRWPTLACAQRLALQPAAALGELPASVACWSVASKLALGLAARERVVPTLAHLNGRLEARWSAALSASEDAEQVLALARSMPLSAHAVPAGAADSLDVWAPEALLRAFLDAVIDALVRSGATAAPAQPAAAANDWRARWQKALTSTEPQFEARGFGERSLVEDLQRWSEPAVGARDRLRACFRLEFPEPSSRDFSVRFLLQSPDDASLLVSASEIWNARGQKLDKLGRAFAHPEEALLEALGRAARLYPPLEAALESKQPESLRLDPTAAYGFLSETAGVLAAAGFGVIVPGELTQKGSRRLRLRMRAGGKSRGTAGVVEGASELGLETLIAVDWLAAVGDETLTVRELAALAAQKTPLVRHRGAWIAIDPQELSEIQKRIRMGGQRISLREALAAALEGETQAGELSASVSATGAFADLVERLRGATAAEVPAPASLRATLRPYQARGLSWLSNLGELGLGACLADDMGLGKTLQLLAAVLRYEEVVPADRRPALLVAPTSVIGNWEREAARFAPTLQLVPHYGSNRARTAEQLAGTPGLVVTSYGLLRRDAQLFASIDWSFVVLDEAQNIKNAASATAQAARKLRASHRYALTGTPVENRLAELWSILEFANPGLLGPLERFRREFAVPIERYANDEAATRLRRIVAPFVLRRVKTDPNVIQDLPAKNEATVVCTLTREQASLYQAIVTEELRRIESAEGIERRGRVLALLTFLKQVCNHPAQYLSERGPLPQRSGKLARLSEMLEEAIAAGDRALVFTQYREMGELLLSHLTHAFGPTVEFLHGGTSKRARDALVERFQTDPNGPRVLVLSLKAGGTGLNLTAATHVFHYDRWWNPAVEDQATDRAYRIGQTRSVQVHRLVCAGTVEDRVDQMLEKKRGLAAKIVASGEQWITELGDAELRELFTLSAGAVVEEDPSGDEAAASDGPRAQRKRRKPANDTEPRA